MVNRISQANIAELAQTEQLDGPDSTLFEYLATYSVLSESYRDDIDLEAAHTGGEDDTGIDGLGIIVNGSLVDSSDEVEDLAERNGYIEAAFYFIQAKATANLEAADAGDFGYAVADFFAERPKLPRNPKVKAFASIQESVFARGAQFARGNPDCHLRLVYDGAWQEPKHVEGRRRAVVEDLRRLNIFHEVTFEVIDSAALQRLYAATKRKVEGSLLFPLRVVLPEMVGVDEAYLGIVPAKEYLSLVTDLSGGINRSLFEDNVRDFLDDTTVNQAIRETLVGDHKERFSILNNGVTVVARNIRVTGNRVTLQDYQIVNGCQTSYVLYDCSDALDDSVYVSVKLIASTDEDMMASVTAATNNQNQVKREDLTALSSFQRQLEKYYLTFEGDMRLFFERRPRQYATDGSVEKIRIVSRQSQIRAFASMFVEVPHRASRYYGTLVEMIGNQVFAEHHKPIPYYTSAYTHYRLEGLFRRGLIDRKYKAARYQLLLVARAIVAGPSAPALDSREIDRYCHSVLDVMRDEAEARHAFAEACEIVRRLAGGEWDWDRNTFKTQGFTEAVLKELHTRS